MSKLYGRPLHDRVIVEPLDEEKVSAGGIVLAGAQEKPLQGIIRAAGKGRVLEDGTLCPLDLKVGDKVLFGKLSGTEVRIDDKDFLVMREEDIMGVLEE